MTEKSTQTEERPRSEQVKWPPDLQRRGPFDVDVAEVAYASQ
jgi:hypothetical protein